MGENKKHRNLLRCLHFRLAGDERVELPSAVLEGDIHHFITCCIMMMKPWALGDLPIFTYINLTCYLATFRVVSSQTVANILRLA